jgi:hypothetical protein
VHGAPSAKQAPRHTSPAVPVTAGSHRPVWHCEGRVHGSFAALPAGFGAIAQLVPEQVAAPPTPAVVPAAPPALDPPGLAPDAPPAVKPSAPPEPAFPVKASPPASAPEAPERTPSFEPHPASEVVDTAKQPANRETTFPKAFIRIFPS